MVQYHSELGGCHNFDDFHPDITSGTVYVCWRGDHTCRCWSGSWFNHGLWMMELPSLDLLCVKKHNTASHIDSCMDKPLPTAPYFCLTTYHSNMHEHLNTITSSFFIHNSVFCFPHSQTCCCFFLVCKCVFPNTAFTSQKKKKKTLPPLPIYLFSLFHLYSPVL